MLSTSLASDLLTYSLIKSLQPKRQPRRRYLINENKFEEITDHDTAYWLGFSAADLCVYNNRVELELTMHDHVHVMKFRDFLQSTHPVYQRSRQRGWRAKPYHFSRLMITSQRLSANLARHGIVPNKTFALDKPPDMDEIFLPSFWRGFLDGDGSLSDGRLTLVGNRPFLEHFERWQYAITGDEIMTWYETPNGQTWQLSKSARWTVQIILRSLQYHDLKMTALDRKREQALRLLEGLEFGIVPYANAGN